MKTAIYKNSDAKAGVESEHPSSAKELGCFKVRLREAIGSASVRGFASKCGLSQASVLSYLSGDTFPTLDRLAAIAAAAEKPMTWFLGADEAGHSPVSQSLSAEELTIAVQLASEALEERNGTLPPAKFAELVTIIFELLRDGLPEAKVLRLARAMEGREGG